MNPHLSPPFQRALAIAILIAMVAAIYYALAQPLINAYADGLATIAQRQEELLRYQRAAQELSLRQHALNALQQQHATADGFLEGTSDTLIAAQIQNRVKALAATARAELKSSQVLPAEADGKLKRIAIRNQISADIAGLQALFHDLEAQSPSLFLDNVTLQVRPMALRDRDNPGNGDTIDVQFDVYGYAQGSG